MTFTRCTRCLIPNTRPDTHFEDGVCSACRAYDARPTVNWDMRRLELIALLDRHDGRCIVPSSGGKDSTAQVMMLKELGADVTVVTATTCHLTPIGRANIDNLARHARTIEVTPNMATRAALNRLGLETVGDISWPEHVSIFTTPFRMAVLIGIPLLFYGENPQNQYGGPPGSEESRTMTRRWVSEFGGFLGLRVSDVAEMGYDMRDYLPPSDADLQRVGVEAHFLGQYLPWDSHRNAAMSIGNGMRYELPSEANWWLWENLDNAQTGLHDHMMYRKYGYGRACAQLSVDIRAGEIGRDEANLINAERDGRFPFVYAGVTIEEVLDRIGMRREKLLDILRRFTNWSLFETEVGLSPLLKEHGMRVEA